jgi:hypothetical protein
MKTLLLAVVAFVLLPVFSMLAQERTDIIHLKNGDVLRGIIIENIPNDRVKIELPGGSVLTVKYADILKFTKEKPSTDLQEHQQPQQLESSGQMDFQQIMAYENEKKTSSIAVGLSIFLPSSGHAYADNWARGLLFTAARVGGGVLVFAAGSHTVTYSMNDAYGTGTMTQNEFTVWFYLGIGIATVFTVWEAIDASAEVVKYNENLHDRIMGKKPYGFNIVPRQNGPQLQFTYDF